MAVARDISIGLHDITDLFSCEDGTKHKERIPNDIPTTFFKCSEPSPSASSLLHKFIIFKINNKLMHQ